MERDTVENTDASVERYGMDVESNPAGVHMVSSYADAAWFKACEGYLVFCLWLLDRCYALSDVATPQSEKACHRVFLWFMLLLHVRRELGLGSEMFRIIEPPHCPCRKYLSIWVEATDPASGAASGERRPQSGERRGGRSGGNGHGAADESSDEGGQDALRGRLGDPLWEGQARDAADKACDRVGQFLELLDLYPSIQEEQKVEIPTISSEVEKLWTSELQQLQKLSSDEEEKRQELARGIEAFLRYDVGKWPECKVEVFGSSMSMFGSPDSDLDMCVLKDSSYLDNEFPGELQGFYYLKRLMERNVWDDHPAESCTDDKMDKLNKHTHKPVLRSEETIVQGTKTLHSSTPNRFYWSMLSQLSMRGLARKGKTAKRRKNDLFDLKSIFESEGFEVDTVVAHARIPVLRFRYSRSGLDYKCDLCFDNELSVWNTRLLRAYASFDERARDLGIAVKHWAKQRGVSDTASGFLSSYSYVLMSRECSPEPAGPTACADIPPVEHHNKSIAFCEDREIAKIYHEKSIHEGELVDKSLPTLLLVFFKFYTTQFDCINHVVAVRSPDYVVQKTELWGNKAKTCRLSIQERRAISVGCSILMLNESSLKSYAVDMNSSTVGRVFWKLFA
ncbi:PAP/25A-associated [Phytophthora cactorum]|nr:PAP/25A-associated [Phytophthora cactorum]